MIRYSGGAEAMEDYERELLRTRLDVCWHDWSSRTEDLTTLANAWVSAAFQYPERVEIIRLRVVA